MGVPYLKAKLDDLYEIRSGGAIRYLSNSPLPSQPPKTATRREKLAFYMKRYFRLVYPYVNMGWYLAILGWHLQYLFGKTDYHSPLFKLTGLRIQRLGPHDMVHSNSNVLIIRCLPCRKQMGQIPPRRVVHLLPSSAQGCFPF